MNLIANIISLGFPVLKLLMMPELFAVTACILLSISDALRVSAPSLQPFSSPWPL